MHTENNSFADLGCSWSLEFMKQGGENPQKPRPVKEGNPLSVTFGKLNIQEVKTKRT